MVVDTINLDNAIARANLEFGLKIIKKIYELERCPSLESYINVNDAIKLVISSLERSSKDK